MIVLTVNTGSSSVRLNLFEITESKIKELYSTKTERLSTRHISAFLNSFLSNTPTQKLDAIIHRFVHGGDTLREPTVITEDIRQLIESVSELAPLHNPHSLSWLDAAVSISTSSTKQIAVFDTGLYQSLPKVARTYALPHKLATTNKLYRYGFHGIAHSALYQQSFESKNSLGRDKVITLQLGSGCSVTAFLKGRAIDTSMGFSPLEGLMMSTRSGDVDPGLLLYMQRTLKLGPQQLEDLLYNESGLLGVSGKSADLREVMSSSDDQSKLAVELYCHRIRKTIGGCIATLGGVNTIVFGGGVGENAPIIRKSVLENFAWCGLKLDKARNESAIKINTRISTDDSTVDVRVTPVNEADEMIRQASLLILNH